MTVRLECRSGKAAGKDAGRSVIPGVAKAFFTGMLTVPFLFAPAKGAATALSGSQPSAKTSFVPLIDSSASDSCSGKMTAETFMSSYSGPKTERIADDDVELATPDSSLRQLAAAGYKISECRTGSRSRMHSCTLVDKSDTFSVTTDLQKGNMRVSLKFKKENDRYEVPAPGTRNFEADSFVTLVRRLPETQEWAGLGVGQWSATKIFLEKMDGTGITRAFFVPVDSRGRAVTALGNGRYLVFALIYHSGCIVDGRVKVLYDKGGYSIPVAGENK